MWWILAGIVVLGLACYAFWPHRRGVADRKALRSRALDQGKSQPYSNPSGPNFPAGHM